MQPTVLYDVMFTSTLLRVCSHAPVLHSFVYVVTDFCIVRDFPSSTPIAFIRT